MSAKALTSAMTACVITVSDGCHAGTRVDTSGPALADFLRAHGWDVAHTATVPDDPEAIVSALSFPSDVIVTTGGTGVSPRDVTPEATRRVITTEIPGLGELMRAAGLRKTPRAALSRGVAGIREGRLIVNLPGSPKGALESLESIFELLEHVVNLANGRAVDHS